MIGETQTRVADAIAHALPDGRYDELPMSVLHNAAAAALEVLNKALEARA